MTQRCFNYRLPDITTVHEGEIYKDKWDVKSIVQRCRNCGELRFVTMRHGQPINDICWRCFNRTPEKRAIMRACHEGKKQDAEVIEIRRQSIKAYYEEHPEARQKISQFHTGRKRPAETSMRISLANKGQYMSLEQRAAHSIKMKQKWADPEWAKPQQEKMREGARNAPESEAIRRVKIGVSSRKKWQDPQFRDATVAAVMRGAAMRPTTPELKMTSLLNALYPSTWIYNGNRAGTVIGGMVPDFIHSNGRKVIEVFGDYYHNPAKRQVSESRTELGRIRKLKEHGYDCLVVWEHELEDADKVAVKVSAFMGDV